MAERYLRLVALDGDDPTSAVESATSPTAQQVADALLARTCPDERAFDRFLPQELRRVSNRFWTPLAVALRVADWLERFGVRTVVDIGSGAGKLCVAGALACQSHFVGIEQRRRLVDAARDLAAVFGVDRARFIHGSLELESIPIADAYYLYNPFGENLYPPDEHLDGDVELSPTRYVQDVAVMEEFFDRAQLGTFVIKYNGFGGQMPSSYEEVLVARDMHSSLRLWRKTRGGTLLRTRSSAIEPTRSPSRQ